MYRTTANQNTPILLLPTKKIGPAQMVPFWVDQVQKVQNGSSARTAWP